MQLIVQNSTPQKRRIFVLNKKFDIKDVNSIVFGAWQKFDLESGDSDYTAYKGLQITARSLIPSAQHQTIQVEASLSESWAFQLDSNSVPIFTKEEAAPLGGSISCANRSPGAAMIGIHLNCAPIEPEYLLPSENVFNYMLGKKLYFYVSVSVVDEQQPIVFEPYIGELTLSNSELTANFVQDNNIFYWNLTPEK